MAEENDAQVTKEGTDLRLCRRCHKYFDFEDKPTRASTCKYHPKTYAVRYHPEGRNYYAAVEEIPRFDGWAGACW